MNADMSLTNASLKGKAAIVTGATSGIGLGIAKGFAQAGCDVLIDGFAKPEEVEAILTQLRQYGGQVVFSPADMSKVDQIEGMVKLANDSFGKVDILVNNAGVQVVSPIEDFPPEKWDLILAINLSAAFHTARLTMKAMKERKWGRIINIASAHGHVASPFKSAYVAAKHGIVGLTKTIALEGAEFRVTANCISPGYVLTPLVESQIPATMEARKMTREQVIRDVLLHAQPTKEFVTVEQIAATALFLCSDAAAQINGTAIQVDGGWTAQ